MLKRVIIWLKTKCMDFSPLDLTVGIASTHFPHLVKGPEVIIGRNEAGREHILCANTWQGWHFLTTLTQYLNMDGQK